MKEVVRPQTIYKSSVRYCMTSILIHHLRLYSRLNRVYLQWHPRIKFPVLLLSPFCHASLQHCLKHTSHRRPILSALCEWWPSVTGWKPNIRRALWIIQHGGICVAAWAFYISLSIGHRLEMLSRRYSEVKASVTHPWKPPPLCCTSPICIISTSGAHKETWLTFREVFNSLCYR